VNSKKKILIAPLDWGLGHATRCIPIANALIERNYDVIFACDGRPLKLLKNEFPSHDFIKLPGYDIRYPKSGNMTMSML
jgi:UDP:flavonoid glycosyltransferase YjiC (YdhE family)